MSDALNQNASQYLLPGLDPTLIAGYQVQKAILVDLLSRNDVGAYEILNNDIGLLAVAVMHSFSRGRYVRSPCLFDCKGYMILRHVFKTIGSKF
jgi:hypothetical protein